MNMQRFSSSSKPWWQSKTIWISALTLIIGIVGFIAGQDFIASNPQVAGWFTMGLGLLNIILRFLTGKPITKGQ